MPVPDFQLPMLPALRAFAAGPAESRIRVCCPPALEQGVWCAFPGIAAQTWNRHLPDFRYQGLICNLRCVRWLIGGNSS